MAQDDDMIATSHLRDLFALPEFGGNLI